MSSTTFSGAKLSSWRSFPILSSLCPTYLSSRIFWAPSGLGGSLQATSPPINLDKAHQCLNSRFLERPTPKSLPLMMLAMIWKLLHPHLSHTLRESHAWVTMREVWPTPWSSSQLSLYSASRSSWFQTFMRSSIAMTRSSRGLQSNALQPPLSKPSSVCPTFWSFATHQWTSSYTCSEVDNSEKLLHKLSVAVATSTKKGIKMSRLDNGLQWRLPSVTQKGEDDERFPPRRIVLWHFKKRSF